MRTTNLAVIVAFALNAGAAWADALRCGASIVEAGAPVDQLVAECGEPDSKDINGGIWTYKLSGNTYEVRVSPGGEVAEIHQVGE